MPILFPATILRLIKTVFSQSLNTDTAGNGGFSFRNICAQSTATGGRQVRVTFSAPSGSGVTTDHASIGISSGSGATAATPVELLFEGAHGFTLSAGQTIVSDWVWLTSLTTDSFVVTVDINSGSSAVRNLTASSGSSFFKSGATYNVQSPASLTSDNRFWEVTKVEVRS